MSVDRIRIELVKYVTQSDSSNFTVNYDREAKLFEISSLTKQEWLYGININGSVIFDFGPDRTIQNIDILKPKHGWKRDVSKFQYIDQLPRNKAGVLFPMETLTHETFDLECRFIVQENHNEYMVLFEEKNSEDLSGINAESTVIELSHNFRLLISNENLVGFWFSHSEKNIIV